MWRVINLTIDIFEWIFKHLVIALPWIMLGIGTVVWFLTWKP